MSDNKRFRGGKTVSTAFLCSLQSVGWEDGEMWRPLVVIVTTRPPPSWIVPGRDTRDIGLN
jgi:hypothetical protein